MLNVLSLFAGIGGFDLGLERTGGFRTVAFCEIEPFCRAVLAKHWPGVPCYDDVRTLTGERLAADGVSVDVVCGGFPCQDISVANPKGSGLKGKRSGLWFEYARIVREIGPDWIIVENSPNLRTRGADRVLSDLDAAGYACWPGVVGAAHAGAPHRRGRVFILAHARRLGFHLECGRPGGPGWENQTFADWHGPNGILAHGNSDEPDGRIGPVQMGRSGLARNVAEDGHAPGTQWSAEPGMGRVVHGVPNRMDRLAALGNAVVPAIAEAHGNAILSVEAARTARGLS